uniref:PGG domain-containing protein n=1 Tax=Lactuca sativa TaxID=4236 RepID=A0A9R1V0J8_LACSA|nr:hypothetical protein LSAT_V11C700362810 [Lactuca sativa]
MQLTHTYLFSMRMAFPSNPSSSSSSSSSDASSLYPDPFHANVSNFVSVKLSSERNYRLWEKQIGCLLKSYNLLGIVCEPITPDLITRFDGLVKGWIFGSISEELLDNVVELESAKAVWDKLGSIYCPAIMIPQTGQIKITRNKESLMLKAILKGKWQEVKSKLKEDKAAATEAINSDGNTVLHIAVGIGRNILVNEILSLIEPGQLPNIVNVYGSTALHIAAIVGNTEAATLLIKKDRSLLEIENTKCETPLHKAFQNMHLDTIDCLLKAIFDDIKGKKMTFPLANSVVNQGVNLLVNAVSAKKYDLATELVKSSPDCAVQSDDVLLAIAKTFPIGLDYWETLIYPSMGDICERIVKRAKDSFKILVDYYEGMMSLMEDIPDDLIIGTIRLLQYFTLKVPRINNIEKKMKEQKEAKEVLNLVCDEIEKLEFDVYPRNFYIRPILEAACQDIYEVVDEILMRSPEAIRYKDENGYDVIQLAVIHRSEKVYNLIHTIGERKSVYRMIEDSSKNNMLHLVGRLPPLQKLRQRKGPALQLQRELHWRQEVEKLVLPTCTTKENTFKETPDKVFRREHENMVKEAEKWMKAVAESCSITAALITTIVFAAAITVPGGSNQETGIPVFTKEIAFTIFAITDAISLFASSTALLMFLSILTGSFDERDFLVILPRRLMIGLCALMLSTTAMMVAFGATLFLVFCHKRPWMLAPICVLSSVPIATFGKLQIPLILDLCRSTYVNIFGIPN